MTKEQEEAIGYVQKQIDYFEKQIKFIEAVDRTYYEAEYKLYKNRVKQFETVLNMLKENSAEIEQKNTELAEKSAEIEKKDKEIDLILDKLNENYTDVFKNNEVKGIIEIYEKIKNTSNLSGIKLRKECIKQYFERKAKDGRN